MVCYVRKNETPHIISYHYLCPNIDMGILAQDCSNSSASAPPVASFIKEVYPRLAKCPLKTNGRLANRGLTSL